MGIDAKCSGRDGCDKYQVCQAQIIIFFTVIAIGFYFSIATKSCFWNPKTLSKVSAGVYRGWCTRNVCSFSASFSRWPTYLRFHYENITFNKRLLFSCWPRLLKTYHNLRSHWTCFTWEYCSAHLNPVNTHILVFWMIWNQWSRKERECTHKF